MNECLFCKIIKGEVSSHKVYEDKKTYAFLDINPRTEGHTLVIPKKHHKTIMDMPPEETANLFKSVNEVAKAVYRATDAEGLNILQNNKEVAGQVVDHVHVHIIPRTKKDNFKVNWNHDKKENELKKVQEKIKKEL